MDLFVADTRSLRPAARREALLLAGHSVRQDAHCIGWVPWQFYEQHDERGTLAVCVRDGDIVGYVAWSVQPAVGAGQIMQIWVRRDARMIEHGRVLVRHVLDELSEQGLTLLRLWCADDLEAVWFWGAMGFNEETRRLGRGHPWLPGRQPSRTHILFSRPVPAMEINPWQMTPVPTSLA